MKIIQVTELKKNYGSLEAVRGLDFYVEKASLFAFLGENGAGKSTTIHILAGLLKKSSGTILINNHDIDTSSNLIKKQIGMVFQDHYLDEFLTVEENLVNRGKMYGLSNKDLDQRIYTLSETLEASDILKQKYKSLSGGQKRKTDIMRALLHQPKILILDEPTTGLDPYTRHCVWETILKLKETTDLTIFLTTHYMEEAKKSDYMVILDHGLIKAKGKPEDLRVKHSIDKLRLHPKDHDFIEIALKTRHISYSFDQELISIPLNHQKQTIQLLNELEPHINYFEVIRGTMDDVFINILKGESNIWF